MRIEEILLLVEHAPLGHYSPTTRYYPRYPICRIGDVVFPHPCVDGEVVYPLLCLLYERIAVHLPVQRLHVTIHLLQRLVERHSAYGDWRIADNPLAGLVNIIAGGEVHHRVCPPAAGPHRFLHLLMDGGGDGRIADIGVDLGEETLANDHRLHLWVVDIGRQYRPPSRYFAPHELPGYRFWHSPSPVGVVHSLHVLVLAYRHKFHLGSHYPPFGVAHLRHLAARFSLAGLAVHMGKPEVV